jgi:hypothetical protein
LKLNQIGNYNTAVGYLSLSKSLTHWNSAFGANALENNSTGEENTAVGLGSMNLNTGGSSNTAIGVYSLRQNTTGDYNVAIGRSAGTSNLTGNQNTFLGYFSNLSGVRTNATSIGAYALAECSNCLILGSVDGKNGATVTTKVGIGTTNPAYLLSVGVVGDGSQARANAWNIFSDERYKTNIEEIPNALEKIENLHGYYYNWKSGKDASRQAGLLAQEVESVLPEIVSTDNEGYKSVDYGKMNALLIQAIKEQQKEIAELKAILKSKKIQ